MKSLLPLGFHTRYLKYEFTETLDELHTMVMADRPMIKTMERAVPATSLSRVWNFAKLGGSLVGNTLYQSARSGFSGSLKEYAVSQSNIDTLTEGLLKMRGAALKLGQFLSFQDSKEMPPALLQAMERTRREAYIMPKVQLERVMTQELGKHWESLFDSFEMTPFAAASIGQVHKAVHKGKKVAVKIQYPGVDTSIESDLANLKFLFKWARILPRGLFFDSLADSIKEDLVNECNYLLEAAHQSRFKELLKKSPEFNVPQVIGELSTQHILVSEYLDSFLFEEFVTQCNQKTRDWIGTKILELTLREIFEFKYMQTDPNPANFQYNPRTNTLDVLDFGATRTYPPEFIEIYKKAVTAGVNQDMEGAIKWSNEIGYFVGDEDKAMFDAHGVAMLAVGEPFIKEELYDFGKQDITPRVFAQGKVMLKHRKKPPPAETYTLHRKLSGAYLLCMKLKARVPAKKLFQEHVQK